MPSMIFMSGHSVLTVKVSIGNWEMQEDIKNEIYDIASKYHIVDITIEFD